MAPRGAGVAGRLQELSARRADTPTQVEATGGPPTRAPSRSAPRDRFRRLSGYRPRATGTEGGRGTRAAGQRGRPPVTRPDDLLGFEDGPVRPLGHPPLKDET